MPGIGVVANPRSRDNQRHPHAVRRLQALVGDSGDAAITHTLDELYRVAERYRAAGIEVLGINGGDGTLHQTLTAFLRTYGDQPLPPVAILRGGTMNNVAESLGIHGDPARLLGDLAQRCRSASPLDVVERDIPQVGEAYGFVFGNGLIYNFLAAYYGTGHPSAVTAASLLLRSVGSALVGGPLSRRLASRFAGHITVDGQAWARSDFLAVAASCVEQLGLGFRPFPRAGQPGTFQILGILARSPLALATQLPRIHAGLPLEEDQVIDQLAREVLFEADTIRYTIDGDTYEARAGLRLCTGPRLRFVRPPGAATTERVREAAAHLASAALGAKGPPPPVVG